MQGTRIFVAAGTNDLHVIDLADPYSPVEVAAYDTPDIARSVAVAGDRIFVADNFGGLLVLAFEYTQQLATAGLAR